MPHLRPTATHAIVESDRTDRARLELRAGFTAAFKRYKGTGHRVSNKKQTGIYTPAAFERFRVVGRTALYNDLTDAQKSALIADRPAPKILTGEHLKEMRGMQPDESLVDRMLPDELQLHIELLNRTRKALEPMKQGTKTKAMEVVMRVATELRAEFKRGHDGQGPEHFAGASPIGDARKRVRLRDRRRQTATGQFLLSLAPKSRRPRKDARAARGAEDAEMAEIRAQVAEEENARKSSPRQGAPASGCPCLGYTP